MNTIRISITAFADDGFPGWVDFEIIDANGVLHQFVEKVPVVSVEDLRHDSVYPREETIACTVNTTWTDELGRDLSRIDTSQPWGIESKAGVTEFVVFSNTIQST
jgi:hypothetical protein